MKERIQQILIAIHHRALSNPTLVKAFHTFWQSFLGVFVLGASGIASNLIHTHNISDAKTATLALVAAAFAAALSATKSYIWPIVVSWAASNDIQITPPK